MNDDFKYACEAIKPYFDTLAKYLIEELQQGVLHGDADGFHQAKAEFNLIQKIKTLIDNSTNSTEE